MDTASPKTNTEIRDAIALTRSDDELLRSQALRSLTRADLVRALNFRDVCDSSDLTQRVLALMGERERASWS
jgi:hypothetical protein